MSASHGVGAPTEQILAGPGERVLDARERSGNESCAELTHHAVDGLKPGQSIVLVADHDPVGLQYMLAAERPGETGWELLLDGPVTWQARITRTAG